jgi:general secretion pathway protein D
LEQRSGVDLLSAPRVTTFSGRQAQIQTGETRAVVTGLNPQALIPPGITGGRDATNQLYQTNSMRFGPVLDVTPTLSADGFTVSLRMNTTVTEFLGYDENTNFVTAYINGRREQVARPSPRFRVRETSVTANVWDGQTVVLLNPVEFLHSLKPNGEPDTREITGSDKKPLVVFVTVSLVDQTGNTIHTEEEMPFAKDSIPPQSPIQKRRADSRLPALSQSHGLWSR